MSERAQNIREIEAQRKEVDAATDRLNKAKLRLHELKRRKIFLDTGVEVGCIVLEVGSKDRYLIDRISFWGLQDTEGRLEGRKIRKDGLPGRSMVTVYIRAEDRKVISREEAQEQLRQAERLQQERQR